MYCTSCGASLPDNAVVCPVCNAPVDGAPSTSVNDGLTAKVPVDKTTLMPKPGSSWLSDDSSDAGLTTMPSGYDSPTAPQPPIASQPPVAPPQSTGASKGLVAAASVLATLAVVAVLAAVMIVADPFGLDLLGRNETEPESQEQVTQDEQDAEGEQNEELPEEEPEETVDLDAPEESDPVEEPDPAPSDPEPVEEPVSTGTYMLADSASRLYSTQELSGMSNWELYIARNEIYARHGRRFRKDDLQNYFNNQPWYTPLYGPDEFDAQAGSLLSSIEQQNAATMLSIEQSRGSQYI